MADTKVLSISQQSREALKPYADLILKIESMVRESTPVELALLSEACMSATQTNCAQHEYMAALVIRSEILRIAKLAPEAE